MDADCSFSYGKPIEVCFCSSSRSPRRICELAGLSYSLPGQCWGALGKFAGNVNVLGNCERILQQQSWHLYRTVEEGLCVLFLLI